MKKKILIFGGTGYLGYSIAQRLNKKKYEVIIASRKALEPKYKNIKLKKYNNRNIHSLLQNIEYVICANGPSKDSFKKNKDKTLNTYIQEMNLILINCKINNIKKIIYLSSIHVLSSLQNLDDNFKYYIKSKKKVESNIKKLFSKNKHQIKILRLTNIFGYYDKNNHVESFSLVKDFIYQAKKKNQIKVISKINFSRIFFPIELFLKYLIFFIENNRNNLIYNIGDKKFEFTILDLATKIKNIFFKKNKKKIIIAQSLKKEKKIIIKRFLFFKTKKIKNNINLVNRQIFELL